MTNRRWLAVWLWAALILTLTSIPNPPDLNAPQNSDKLVHVLMYGVLAALTVRALGADVVIGVAVLAIVIVSALGALDELHQRFIPGRSADVADWEADSAGAVAMGMGTFVIQRLRTRV